MFSAKLFNRITIMLVVIFFLSITISTISDIQKEADLQLQFNSLLQDVENFNQKHSEFFEIEETLPVVESLVNISSGKEALEIGYDNYKNATSYYSESYGTLNFSVKIPILKKIPFKIDMYIKSIQFEDGDFIQEVVAKESGGYGGQGGFIIYYDKQEEIVYRNFTWSVTKQGDEYVPNFNDNSWKPQSIEDYIKEFGAYPGTPFYEFNQRSMVEELYYKKIYNGDGSTKQYHAQYKLNASVSTKMYINFLTYIVNYVRDGFVKNISFKSLEVSAIVDDEGYFKMTEYQETYDATVKIDDWGGIVIKTSCTANISYMYALFNEPIPYEKPVINK